MFVTDIASTGISAAETADVSIGDSVVVYAQGPIGLCATAGARLKGAALIIGVNKNPTRLEMAKKMGADEVIDITQEDPVARVKALTDGRGADVAIEALGIQETFENCLASVRPPASSRRSASTATRCRSPSRAFVYGIGDIDIRTTLCPGGKERHARADGDGAHRPPRPQQLITHRFALEDIEEAYPLFSNQEDDVIKVAITP